MKRIAILGGGIAGLAAAYELEQQRRAGKPVDWHLFEASDRLGGIIETTRLRTDEGEYILEGGPDAWITEKPWARELAEELGLGDQIITSRDEDKKTYLWLDGELIAMPDRMRMMVPEDLATLEKSPLFTAGARAAYARELERAEALKAIAPQTDESVASFVLRHFGDEVLNKIGAPLLSGVFGGDVHRLSVRAVMPAFVKMEAEHGSLVAALRAQTRSRGEKSAAPTFTTLRRGMGSLVEAIVAHLPSERLHLRIRAEALGGASEGAWFLRTCATNRSASESQPMHFDHLLIAIPIDGARALLGAIDGEAVSLVPGDASSAILTCFCWPQESARTFAVPAGFGFLVPQSAMAHDDWYSKTTRSKPSLLAVTFVDQKFTNRSPAGARVIRAFFGGQAADALRGESDAFIANQALRELQAILPGLPAADATLTRVWRWPRSLPQYEVGHIERMAELNERIGKLGHLHLLGNGYRGVGVPDLVRDARTAARDAVAELQES